jgi:acylphosphatase
MQRAHIIVHGYVQGVFFRHNTKQEALSLGLKGYVKNMPDGTVEIIAEGPEDKISKLIGFCKSSPGASDVTKVDVNLEKATGEFDTFGVRH